MNAIWLLLGTLPQILQVIRIKDLMFTKEDTLTVSISNNAFQEVFQVLDGTADTWTEDQKNAIKRSVKSCNGER